ncbi:PucR family transcriptional regulator [Pseudomonas knackmussii]|uniref:PucR family transcriptional regulator n=1 Tax=Pseudomonas knackmussii TaxID=65741 RepID=UPI001363237F|nr:helix-turn-helix domain-containing protein [Pseudomonas knackmussii]
MQLTFPSPQSGQWPAQTPRVRELLRRGAEHVLTAPAEWLEEIDLAGLSPRSMKSLTDDPVLMSASRRAARFSLIHWARANIERPGEPVPPYIPADEFNVARELLQRGQTELLFNASRAAQATAWQQWMGIAFELTSDPAELRGLLEVSSRSISDFIGASLELLAEFLNNEREALLRDSHVERRDLVTAIIEGRPVNVPQAGRQLGYGLEQAHHAAVIWSEEADTELATLESAAAALVRCAGARRSLTVFASAATLWVWIPGAQPIDQAMLQAAIRKLPAVHLAIGSGGEGIEGFRRAHLDALTTQRVLGRLQSRARVVSFDDIRLVSLMTRDPKANQRFVAHTLGQLATASPQLRRSLLTFLACGSNATLAAQRLHTHRNTLLRRLVRAQELLPRPLDDNRVHVAAALEALNWAQEAEG